MPKDPARRAQQPDDGAPRDAGHGTLARTLAAALLALLVTQLPTFMTAALVVQMRRDLRLTAAGLGTAITAPLAAAALGSVASGKTHRPDRIGWTAAVRSSALITAAALLMIGLFVRTLMALTVILAVAGFSKSLAHRSSNLALTAGILRARQGLAFGIKQSRVPAALIAGLAVPAIALTVGWRAAFLPAAGLAIAFAMAVSSFDRNANHTPYRTQTDEGLPQLPRAVLIHFGLGAGVGVAARNSVAAFLVIYAVDIGIGEPAAGLLLVARSPAAFITRVTAGAVADRAILDLRDVSVMLALGAVGIAVLTIGTSTGIIAGALLALGAGWGWSGLLNLVLVRSNPRAPGIATGFTQARMFVGAGFGPSLFGVAEDQWGFQGPWRGLAAVAAGSAIMWTANPKPHAHMDEWPGRQARDDYWDDE